MYDAYARHCPICKGNASMSPIKRFMKMPVGKYAIKEVNIWECYSCGYIMTIDSAFENIGDGPSHIDADRRYSGVIERPP